MGGMKINVPGSESPIYISDSPSADGVVQQMIEQIDGDRYDFKCGCISRDSNIYLCAGCNKVEESDAENMR